MPGPRCSPGLAGSGRPAPKGQVWCRPTETSPCTSKARAGRLPGTGLGAPDPPLCRVAALGLAAGIVLVLLLLCLYRVLCPRNYGQQGGGPGRRRRGDLPCDDYGYAPPETEIVPLVLRGHLMVSAGASAGCPCLRARARAHGRAVPTGHRMPGQ